MKLKDFLVCLTALSLANLWNYQSDLFFFIYLVADFFSKVVIGYDFKGPSGG